MKDIQQKIADGILAGNVRKKVIYVDDFSHCLMTVKDNLKKYYEIYAASSVEKMYEILEHITPEIILLDINMPEVDGFEALKQLKSDERYSSIPVIFLTGETGKDSVVKGLKLGAADYVSKPFSVFDLIERIEKQISTEEYIEEEDSRKKIVYVDDINYSLISLRARLKEHYEVYPVQRADKLFEVLERITPSLILLDINMPGMSGYDVIKRLKSDKKLAEIPVIFLTSNHNKESAIKCFKLGAADYITKPFTDSYLVQRIRLQLNPDTRRKSWREENFRKTLFYVDDVNYSLVSLKSRLKEQYEVFVLNSVSRMFDLLERVIPDLILMDINMPEMNGFEAIRKLKRDIRYSAIPVIFLTSEDGKESMLKGFAFGAADYISKPFTNEDLIKRIENQISSAEQNINSKTEAEELGFGEDSKIDMENLKPCILVVDEAFSVMGEFKYALNDEYDGPLRTLMQKKFPAYCALREEYEICMLSKPNEVKDFLQQNQPDLFILDASTLVSNELDLISLIRKFPEHKDTPVIVITSSETSKYSDSGACDYIVKPFEVEDVREKVRKYVG